MKLHLGRNSAYSLNSEVFLVRTVSGQSLILILVYYFITNKQKMSTFKNSKNQWREFLSLNEVQDIFLTLLYSCLLFNNIQNFPQKSLESLLESSLE